MSYTAQHAQPHTTLYLIRRAFVFLFGDPAYDLPPGIGAVEGWEERHPR